MILAYGSVKWWKIFTPDQCSGINRFVALFAVPPLYATGDDRNGIAVVLEAEDGTDWSTMLPDLLAEIIRRVNAAAGTVLWRVFKLMCRG